MNVVSKALSSCPPLFSRALPLPVLSFIFLYPELSERFGAAALTGRLFRGTEAGQEEERELLELLHTHPVALLNMLVKHTHSYKRNWHVCQLNCNIIGYHSNT